MFAARAAFMAGKSKTPTGSAYFDGTGDYLTVSDNALMEFGSSNLTCEMWVKTTTSDYYDTIFARDPNNLAAGVFVLLINPGNIDGNLAVYCGDYSVGAALLTTTGANVRDDAWHHIAIVRNGSSWVLYVDGISRSSQTWAGSITDLSAGFYIGKDQFNGREFSGYVSNLRVVKGTAIYTSTFTVPTSPLTAVSGTSLLTCNTFTGFVSDSSGNNLTISQFGNAGVSSLNPF